MSGIEATSESQVVPASVKQEPRSANFVPVSLEKDFATYSSSDESADRGVTSYNDLDAWLLNLVPRFMEGSGNEADFEGPQNLTRSPLHRENSQAVILVPGRRSLTPGRSRTRCASAPKMLYGRRPRSVLGSVESKRSFGGRLRSYSQESLCAILRPLISKSHWILRFHLILLQTLKSFAALFAPGVLLSLVLYSTALCFTTYSGSSALSFSSYFSNSEVHLLDTLTSPHPFDPQESAIDEITKLGTSSQPGHVINLTTQCHQQNQEQKEKIATLEGEVSSLRQQFSERLAKKEETIKKLVRGITNFRSENVSVPKHDLLSVGILLVIVASILFKYRFQSKLRPFRA